ncbi:MULTISPECIES: EcpB family pilus assembly chaperone [Gammaproteobacteria]|nr:MULTISPECIES: hypothetical protein [Gammaproteobacteria]MBG5951268.1 hypothetical protein [Proteus terrae]MCD9493242.1 hypothetical protein [Photobacterium phosphoreum]MCE9840001.1 hypothetical protein [Proteus terrae]MCF2192508.1 hypothetical protein [Photobacterium phosphoreum]MCF2304149.1 hypothetical protein [Photobacterium phosphoreum]
MKKIILACLSPLVFYSQFAAAIHVGAITETMQSDQTILAKEIENNVEQARLVGLSIERISSPLEDGKVIPLVNNEILISPANLILPGKTKENFKIFYKGPSDNQERYYRLVWRDDPVTETGSTQSSKAATATTSAMISTILVVAPRQENFSYRFDKSTRIVYNTGNSSFRTVATGDCMPDAVTKNENNRCSERYYVMPGLGVKLKQVDVQSKRATVGIWHNDDFIIIN